MEKQEEAFRQLKERFTKEPVLVASDLDKKNENGKWRPVAFLSKSLNKTERNYEIHDKEMLAIIRGLENWRHLLEGIHFKFEIWMDHKNLEYFMKMQKLNCRQAQ